MPRVAPVLYEFVELDNGEYLKIAEAVFRIFDRQEWLRVNRARARIKVFVDKYGIDELRRQVEEELQGDWVAERDFSIEHRLFLDDEREDAPAPPASYGSPNGDAARVRALPRGQRAPSRSRTGFVTVEVKITRGDLTPEQFRGLAQIMRDYAGGYARTTVQQNLVLRWVREESVYDVWRALSELGLGDAGSREITDVVSCPGTDSCKLGITSSMGLNQAVQERIEAMEITDALTRQINIKISGCPNGCGQHHVGSIGFYGASIKVGEHTIPAYIPHVGGVFEGGEVAFGARLKLRLPAKRVPEAVERWVRHYEADARGRRGVERRSSQRVGTAELEALVKDLSMPVDFGLETMNQFIDWNRNVPFEVDPRRGRVRGLASMRWRARWPTIRRHAMTACRHDPARRASSETLREAVERHGGRTVLLCSFQKEESVLLDELLRVATGARRGADRDDRHRRAVPGDAARPGGVRGALRRRASRCRTRAARAGRGAGPEHCCSAAKVAALERALSGADGWITGIRREQGPTRADARADRTRRRRAASWKYNPLAALDRARTCGGGSTSASCRTTRCTTRATSRSAARPARSPGSGREGRWAGHRQDRVRPARRAGGRLR